MLRRLNIHIKFITLFGILISNSCNSADEIIPVLEIPVKIDSVFELKEWLLIGPFTNDSLSRQNQKIYKNADELKMGFNEFGINKSTINKLINRNKVPFYANRLSSLINFSDYFKGQFYEKSIYYTYTNILSEKEKELILVCDGANSYTLWINGAEICDEKEHIDICKIADRFIKIKLKKGNNLVFAKIKSGKVPQSWKLVIGLTNSQYAKTLFLKNYVKDFIVNPVVNSEITIYPGPFDKGSGLISNNRVALNFRFSDKDIKDGNLNITIPDSLDEGFYTCTLNLDGNILEENFFKGNLSNYYQNTSIQNEINSFDNNTVHDLQMANNLTLDFFNSSKQKTNKKSLNTFNYNSIFWFFNLFEAFKYAKQNGNLKNKSGTTIKTFLDQKTGQSVNFIFHVSKQIIAQKKSFPLIIIPICATIGDSPQSKYLFNYSQLFTDSKLADDRGFALCWPFIGSIDSGLRHSSSVIRNALNKLREDYPTIDTTNVYLFGEDISGQKAMLLAQMQPQKYAGLAIQSPFIEHEINLGAQMENIGNLINMDVLLLHDQKFSGSSFSHFRSFIEKVSNLKFRKFTSKQIDKLEFSIEYKSLCFEFFEKVYRTPTEKWPNYIRFKTSDNTFNEIYWLKFTPKDSLSKSVIVAVYYPKNNRLKLYCKNIQTLTIDVSKSGIHDWKNTKLLLGNKLENAGFNRDGKIKISF